MSKSWTEKLVEFFSKEPSTDDLPPEACPNCWGQYEYGAEIRKQVKDRQIDVNNKQEHYAFIQDFVVTQLEGIRLSNNGQHSTCPRCKQNPKI